MAMQYENKTAQRRGFLRSTAALGAGLVLTPLASGQIRNKPPDDLNVALLGAGGQGGYLMNACLKIRGIRIKAVCDIWEKFRLKRVSSILNKYRQPNNAYVDYREMLDKEKDLDAVIIATPDFWHARQTIDSLNAGLHVYCEKPMATTIEDARRMVHAARKTGKLLQIGHHRRSNPRYIRCYEELIKGANILGRILTANAFYRVPSWRRGWPRTMGIEPQILSKYGYESMGQLVNWQWEKTLGAGALGKSGSDQVDVFNWYLGAHPRSTVALSSAGNDDARRWPGNLTAVCDYRIGDGSVRAVYQTIPDATALTRFETFIGENTALAISDALFSPGANLISVKTLFASNRLSKTASKDPRSLLTVGNNEIRDPPISVSDFLAGIRVEETHILSQPGGKWDFDVSVRLDVPPVQIHLQNFFEAIRTGGKTALNCPGEVGYETVAAVLKINEALQTGRRLEFSPDEFKI